MEKDRVVTCETRQDKRRKWVKMDNSELRPWEFHYNKKKNRGRPQVEPMDRKASVNFSITTRTHLAFLKMCEMNGESPNEVLERILTNYIAGNTGKTPEQFLLK